MDASFPARFFTFVLLQGAYGAHVVRTRDLHEAKIVLREENHRQGFLPFTFEHVCEARE
jgi:hypothetical protein